MFCYSNGIIYVLNYTECDKPTIKHPEANVGCIILMSKQSKTPEILEMLELDHFWGEVGHTNQGQNKDKPFFP